MSLQSFRWTSHGQCQAKRHLSSQVLAKPQHHPPPHVWLQKVLAKQITTPAWPWPPSFKSSCLRWCWTPPAQPQGTAPWEDQYQWPRIPHHCQRGGPAQARQARFGYAQAGSYLPAGITTGSQTWWGHANQPFALLNPGIRNSQGDQCPCHPATWDLSWDGPEHRLW